MPGRLARVLRGLLRRRPAAAAAVPGGHRSPSRRTDRRQGHAGGGGGEGEAQPEVPRHPVADPDRRATFLPARPAPRPLAEGVGKGRAGAAGRRSPPGSGSLWKFVPIGSYRDGNTVRQVANDPAAVETQTAEAESEAGARAERSRAVPRGRRTARGGTGGPRRLAPAALRGRRQAGRCSCAITPSSARQYEVDYPAVFADVAKYLAAAAEAANDRKLSADDLAKKHGARPGPD